MAKFTKEVVVSNNQASSRLEAQVGGLTAFIEYRRSPEVITFLHSYVPPPLEGYGIGGKLARAGLEFARGGNPSTYEPLAILRLLLVGIDSWQSHVCNERRVPPAIFPASIGVAVAVNAIADAMVGSPPGNVSNE